MKVKVDYPTIHKEYDILGNIIKKTDPFGNATHFAHDNLGRKISETNAEGGVTKFTFDATGRMSSLTDPVGNKTTWTRNIIGQVSRETVVMDKISRVRYFDYDASGNIIAKYDRNERVTEWTFDKLNRHTSEIWYENAQSYRAKKPYKKFTTTYNKKGKIETIQDNDNKFTFDYGVFENEIKQVQNIAGFNKPIEQNFVTDINGLKTEKSFSVDGKIDHANKYEFDSLNRATNISQIIENNTIKSVQINYDDFGQLVKQSRFDTDKPIIETKNKYDEAGHLINISHVGNNRTYADYDITWDNGNRITDFDFTYLNEPAKKNQSNYRYDKTSQLTSATYNFMQDERYNFDLNGNRKQAEIQGQKQQYKTAEYNRLISDNESEYKYDLEGNRIAKISKDGSTIKYYWDNRNRLIKIETPNGIIEYTYDHQNRIVLRKQGESTTTFIHDGWQIVLQFDNDKPTHRYLWGTKQDELICDNDNWTLGDHLNTIRDIVKSDGTVVAHLEYSSFGKLITHEKNDSTFFAYTGKLTDNVSGLQWNINRWYDANVGRWMSEDPIGFAGRDMNLYRYAYNTPVTLLDPLGNTVSIRTEAECFLIDWLKEHSIKYGVNYVTLASISNKGYTNFYTMLGHSSVQYNNSIEKEIAYQMIKHTSKEFTIAGTDKNSSRDNWLGHISARKNIIFRANTAAFLFGGQGTGSHRGARQKNGVWEQFNGSIPSGFTAHDFAKHLANNQAQYSFYCQMGTAAVMFLGMFDTVTNSSLIANGETYFNSEVGGTSLGVALNVFYTNYTTGDDNFWIPGDAGYIANSAHSLSAPVSAGFEGENIIYLGSGSYWGHQTSGVKQSLAKWKNEVASWGTDGNGGGDIRGSKVDMKRFFPKFGIK